MESFSSNIIWKLSQSDFMLHSQQKSFSFLQIWGFPYIESAKKPGFHTKSGSKRTVWESYICLLDYSLKYTIIKHSPKSVSIQDLCLSPYISQNWDIFTEIWEIWWTMEYPRLEGTSKDHLVHAFMGAGWKEVVDPVCNDHPAFPGFPDCTGVTDSFCCWQIVGCCISCYLVYTTLYQGPAFLL